MSAARIAELTAALKVAIEQLEGWVAWKCSKRYRPEHERLIASLHAVAGGATLVSVIHWHLVADGKRPDSDQNVLLWLSDGTTCEGFLDFEPISGKELWRDVCAEPLDELVVERWAELPKAVP